MLLRRHSALSTLAHLARMHALVALDPTSGSTGVSTGMASRAAGNPRLIAPSHAAIRSELVVHPVVIGTVVAVLHISRRLVLQSVLIRAHFTPIVAAASTVGPMVLRLINIQVIGPLSEVMCILAISDGFGSIGLLLVRMVHEPVTGHTSVPLHQVDDPCEQNGSSFIDFGQVLQK